MDGIDDYESRYADELDMLEDIDPEPGPPSKRSLKFDEVQQHREVEQWKKAEDSGLDQSSQHVIPAKKRDCDEMYSALSDDDSEEELEDIVNGISGPSVKRARLSPSRDVDSNPRDRSTAISSHPIQGSNPTKDRQLGARRVFKRPPMSRESVTVTRTDGQRLFIPIQHNKKEEGSRAHGQSRNTRNSLQLLSVPFSVLKQHVDEQRRIKAMEESERITASLQRHLLDALNKDIELTDELREDDECQLELWVEKYTPKHFTELLSDDAINRTLLKWLKLWDKVVFKKEKKQPTLRNVKQKQEKAGWKKHSKIDLEDEKWLELDAGGYPVHKVALLCGPPGLGKTTLAHVIARHAGYNVVEMNASDDRSVEVFRNKIESSTQMKSVLGAGERPNCLIIDEIDGAPTPAINVLLSIVKHKDSDPVPNKKMKKKKKAVPLSRPIICICNDQYVPSLRQLRQVAFVVPFPTTIPGRLANRLLEVSRKECVSTDMTTLLALSEKADNDIRSCLNTLQFAQKRHGHVALEHIQSLDIGHKDAHRSLFSVWQDIFQLPKPKRRRFAAITGNEVSVNGIGENGFLPDAGIGSIGSMDRQGMSNTSSRFHTILRSAMSSGEYDKVCQGLFENYLEVKFKDPSFEVVVNATEWLEFSDFVERHINQSQNFMLRKFSPFLSVAFHLLFASPTNTKLSYPSSQYESRQKQTRIVNLVDTIKSESSPRIRQNIDVRVVSLELFPRLLEIITPTLRPVNTQLFSAREKQQMAELIDTMIAYNLTYHQERNPEGQYTYILDPNVEEVVKFPGQPQHKQLTYASKQMIAREIDLEKMRRAEQMLTAHNRPTSEQDKRHTQKQENKTQKGFVLNASKAPSKETKPALDFFGQPVQHKSKSQDGNTGNPTTHSQSSVIWFRFKEGYSNAVRKNVKIQDFL